jgi:hypothetical protein
MFYASILGIKMNNQYVYPWLTQQLEYFHPLINKVSRKRKDVEVVTLLF